MFFSQGHCHNLGCYNKISEMEMEMESYLFLRVIEVWCPRSSYWPSNSHLIMRPHMLEKKKL